MPTLHIGQLLKSTKPEIAKNYFATFGTIKSFVWPKISSTQSFHCAFILYEDHKIVKKVLLTKHKVRLVELLAKPTLACWPNLVSLSVTIFFLPSFLPWVGCVGLGSMD